MKRYITILSLLLFSCIGVANSSIHYQEIYQKANKYYSEGDYQKAIEFYQQIIQANYSASDVYYNLGNAYFKQNEIPLSILYFEKAKQIASNDPDIEFNLQLANQRIVDQINPVAELFFVSWYKALVNIKDIDTWAKWSVWLFVITFLLFTLFLLIRNITVKKISFWLGVILIFGTLFTFSSAIQQRNILTRHKYGIVFTPTVTVRSAPDANGTELFVIHEGLKVIVRETADGWCKIALPDGNEGWLRQDDIEVI